MVTGEPAQMSAYEAETWRALVTEADKQAHQSDRFGAWTRGIRARAGEVAGHDLTVDRVLGATQAEEVHFHGVFRGNWLEPAAPGRGGAEWSNRW